MPPESTIAELLPCIFRCVLDALDALETAGASREAARYRQAAIRTYSHTWNEACHRRLEEILSRAEATARDHERRTRLRVA